MSAGSSPAAARIHWSWPAPLSCWLWVSASCSAFSVCSTATVVLDNAVAGLSVLAQVVPGFWLGLVLVLLFAVIGALLPVSGSVDLTHLILPAVTLALPTLGRMTRLVRCAMLEVLGSDYIRTARAKGLGNGRCCWGMPPERPAAGGHAGRTGARRPGR